MKKFIKYSLMSLVLLLSFSFMLVGCGPDEDDTTLYNLQIKVSGYEDEITINAAYLKDGDAEESTMEDCSVTLNSDTNPSNIAVVGSYLYQTRIDLTVPSIPGYKFVGWYDEDSFLGGLGGQTYTWNMFQKHGCIEARFEKWTYGVTYTILNDENIVPYTNAPTEYNIDKGTVSLSRPDAEKIPAHTEFLYWYRYNDNSEEVRVDTLPTDYFNEQLNLFAKLSVDQATITFIYDPNKLDVSIKGNLLTIDGSAASDETMTPITLANELKANYTVEHGSHVDSSSLYISRTVKGDNNFLYWLVNGDKKYIYQEDDWVLHIPKITGDITIEAVFEDKYYSVEVIVEDNSTSGGGVRSSDADNDCGTITVSGFDMGYTILEGTEISLTAAAKSGYKFDGWYYYDGEELYSTVATIEITVEQSWSLLAKFSSSN